MNKRITQSYAPELLEEATKRVLEQGMTTVEVATRLNMNQDTLAYWVTQTRKAGENTPAKAGAQSPTELVAEKIELEHPDYDQLEEARNANDWGTEIFDYFKDKMDTAYLSLFAIGEHFDEYQEFLLTPKADMRAINVNSQANRLGLIIR